jgi:hypothetical protein
LVKIVVPVSADKASANVVAGYSLDQAGRLSVADAGPRDPKKGTVSFLILQPGLYTWVFIPL